MTQSNPIHGWIQAMTNSARHSKILATMAVNLSDFWVELDSLLSTTDSHPVRCQSVKKRWLITEADPSARNSFTDPVRNLNAIEIAFRNSPKHFCARGTSIIKRIRERGVQWRCAIQIYTLKLKLRALVIKTSASEMTYNLLCRVGR